MESEDPLPQVHYCTHLCYSLPLPLQLLSHISKYTEKTNSNESLAVQES